MLLWVNKFYFTFATLLLVFLIAGCNNNESNEKHGSKNSGLDTLLIMHTNDHHGTILPSGGLGGLTRRATLIDSLKKKYKNILILDAGDINTGSVLSNMFNAEPDILGYNLIGYDAMTLGNHEFDKPLGILQKQIELANFEFLSANVKTTNNEFLTTPYIIKHFGNIKVAIIGITTASAKTSALHGKDFIFESEISSAREFVKKAKEENADYIILLTHVGDKYSEIISPMLADSVQGIDLIIDGHSHTHFNEPLTVNGVNIVSAFEWGKEVGQAKIIFENEKPKIFEWKTTTIDSAINESEKVNSMLKPYLDSLGKSIEQAVGYSSKEIPFLDNAGNRIPRMGESEIGNLVCDAIMDFVLKSGNHADFAVINGGGIRAGIPKGTITKVTILTMLPFDNTIEIINLSGVQVNELFDFMATIQKGAGGYPQISKEAKNLQGKIDLEKIYAIATNDYLSAGGDGYEIFNNATAKFKTSKLLSDAVIDYITSSPNMH